MFKPARWRSEKNKIKAVFKLQFHATQVTQLDVDALVVSVVPGDVGKPTVRLEKATIRDGRCHWANPVYETVKFTRDPKTGKINERIYQFIVSTGAAKSGFVGEASVDFADYTEATKASSVSLPLKNSIIGAILHVSIQRLQENVDNREVEENEDTKVKLHDRSLRSHLSNSDKDETNENPTSSSAEDLPVNKTIITQNAELNGSFRASSGSDLTISSSESSSGLNTPREHSANNAIVPHESNGFQSSMSNMLLPHRQKWGWSASLGHEVVADMSEANLEGKLVKASDSEIERLRTELAVTARQVGMSELELQTLRKQIVKESKRGQDLSREMVSLKEERDALKLECEKFKSLHMSTVKKKLECEDGDLRALLEEVREELNHEKNLNANLRVQLQKTQESNEELILAVKDLDEMLEQKNQEMGKCSIKSGLYENKDFPSEGVSRCETDEDEEQKALEEIVKEHRDAKETYLQEQKIMDLSSEIEIYRRDRDELEMQMEQIALDYEILKQKNHEISCKLEQSQLQEQLKMQYEGSPFRSSHELESKIQSLENELKKRSEELTESVTTIDELHAHMKSLEEELEKQAREFEVDLEVVTHAKVEQEQRAIQVERALQTMRRKNVNTAERLQEEFRRLSEQMASTFTANEKVAMRALTEAGELRMQKIQLDEMLQKANAELQLVKDSYEIKLSELSDQKREKKDQINNMALEIDEKSKQLEDCEKHEKEVTENLLHEIIALKTEITRLNAENNMLSKQAAEEDNLKEELRQLKKSITEAELVVQRGNVERNELVSAIALVKKELEYSLVELKRLRHLKDEKDLTICNLETEVKTLRVQCNDLKNSLVEDKSEKENLRKQIFQLKGDLKNKDNTFMGIDKRVKESNGRAAISEGTKNATRNNKVVPLASSNKEASNLREKLKLLEGQIKLKEAALEDSTNTFLEKEKSFKRKIEELESRLDELNHFYPFNKVAEATGGITSESVSPEESCSPRKTET
ncbi:myosin-11-like isoform X2 [Rhodamnia argentea]|uniref:Myosin-11-like isoform X2 n=1 Tax=Rhodamnia argentea TaxID=178133 RepID=A0A8B8QWS9_9MYRT|nr:myosin-11-like isoform X2 [Rhodamnia argentea]